MVVDKQHTVPGLATILALLASVAAYGAATEEAPDAAGATTMAEVVVPGQLVFYGTRTEFESTTGRTLPPYTEAPSLAARVASGELPPVEERVPAEPVVIDPLHGIGTYGGDWTGFMSAPFESAADFQWTRMQNLFGPSPDLQTYDVPNIAQSSEWQDDFKALIINLREGLKWSDGAPTTADDFVFWYQDIMLNEELFPTVRAEFRPGGEVMVVDKLDDYTVRFRFAAPNPTMMVRFGDQIGLRRKNGAILAPAHYLKQFHITHNSKANELAKERGFEDWSKLFLFEFNPEQDASPNVNYAWHEPWVQTRIDDAGNKFYERNPYYFKVDSAGQQLPYLDRNVLLLVESQEVVALKTISGEASVSSFALTLQDWPLYKENEERGDYRAHLWDSARMEMVFHFNHTAQDPVLREIFNDVRFKQAVSLAIDREDINKAVFHGEADQGQATPPPSLNPYVEDWMVNHMAEHDPDRANELLDEMGLQWDAERKWRLRPDGERLSVLYINFRQEGPKWPIAELTKTYLEDIGIEMILKEVTRENNYLMHINNEFEMGGHHYDEGDFPRGWVSHAMAELQPHRHWAPAWFLWKSTGGAKGEEPPPEIKELQDLIDQWQVTPLLTAESERLAKEILNRNTNNLYQIGAGGRAPQPVIVKNGLMNVPERDAYWPEGAWFYNTAPETWFWEK